MNNFEKITATPETLGAFLASLSIKTGPWDESFYKEFCDSCERENCDAENCPHQDVRNNPLWWLTKAAEGEQGAINDSDRELLIREYERRLARLKSGATPSGVIGKNVRIELEPGMIVPLQDEERRAAVTCNEFNVYLNGKGLAGLGLTIGFLVYRYTAAVGDTQLWDFEWTEQGRKRRRGEGWPSGT